MKLKCRYTLTMIFPALFAISIAGCGGSSGNSGDTASTVAIYKFDEMSGSSAMNSSQNRYNGTIYGATRVPGKVANALQFGSAGSRVEIPMVPSNMAFPSGEISIDAWIKSDTIAPGSTYQLIGSGYYGVKSFVLALVNGQIQFFLHDGSTWRSVIVSNQTLITNTWYYVALTYDGATAKIYIDGVEDAVHIISYPVPTSYNTLLIGCGEGDLTVGFTYEFPGIMDEVRIFRIALSATQISDYYNSTK